MDGRPREKPFQIYFESKQNENQGPRTSNHVEAQNDAINCSLPTQKPVFLTL